MKKKVLIFIEDGSYTYDNRVIREANALVDAGWNVTIISPKYPEDPSYKQINSNLRAYYYPKMTSESIFGHMVEAAFSLIYGTIFTFWIYIRHGFDVFHACNPVDILWIIALPYKLLGKKFIFDHHDLVPELFQSRMKTTKTHFLYKLAVFFEKCSFVFSDIVISTNDSYKEIAVSRGNKESKNVFVVRNGPDLEKFTLVPPKLGLKEHSEILVGYIGNMNPQDGVDFLLEAASYIIHEKKRSDIKFILIGGGSSRLSLLHQSVRMKLEKNMTFTGRVPDNEMLAILSACDICVQLDPLNPLNDQ